MDAPKNYVWSVAQIHTHPDIQVRVAHFAEALSRYADLYAEGKELPPVRVCTSAEDGRTYLIDGHHRLLAAKIANLVEIPVTDCGILTLAEMISESIRCNCQQGLALSKADRKRAAEMLCKYYPSMSVRAVAEKVGLSKSLVAEVLNAWKAQTVTVCAMCKASVLRLFAEDATNGWCQTHDKGKERWFCSEDCRKDFYANQAEKEETARLARIEKLNQDLAERREEDTLRADETSATPKTLRVDETSATPETPVLAGFDFSIDCVSENCTAQPYTDTFETLEEAWVAWDKRSVQNQRSKRETAFLQRLKNGIFVGKHSVKLHFEPVDGAIFLHVAISDEYGKISQYIFD